jgi:phosphatidylserine/phosphatidylglycerophosphate/cardiolipin synthase-like enzyme
LRGIKDSIFVKSEIKDNKCTEEIIALLRTAQSHIIIIIIENAYFMSTHTWMNFFKEAQRKGMKITVLANSMQSNDLFLYHAAYLNGRKKLLELGLDIWEYQGPKKLHLKTIIIDGKISIVGSYNVHYPSETLNTEVAVVVEDRAVAKFHLKMIEQNFLNAVHISKENKAEYPKVHNFPQPTCRRKLVVFLSRHTIALWLNRYL